MPVLFGPTVTTTTTNQDVVAPQSLKKTSSITNKLKQLSLNTTPSTPGDSSYINSLKPEDICKHGVNRNNEPPMYPGDTVVLELSCRRLSDVSLIDLCANLVVCNLSNNYLHNVSALKWCVNLLCLDLHSNQITRLPDKECCSAFKKLQVLYLHDNGISKLEELLDLSHVPNLVNLTLYDTPISLKKNYRHCVVNAIWSLKALDHCTVSDEEIIEDANFPKKFKPLQAHFRFKQTYFPAVEVPCRILRETLSLIQQDISAINRIQSKYCPVLIIQRMVRGYLIRLRFNYVMDTRLWAAVSIQRCFRGYKGYPNPPPSTPLLHYNDFIYQSMSSIKLDYEAYLQMRRSMNPSLFSMRSNFRTDWRSESVGMSPSSKAVRKHISINLEKLMGRTRKKKKKVLGSKYGIVVPEPSSDMTMLKEYDSQYKSRLTNVAQLSCAEEYARDLGLNIVPSNANKSHLKIGRYYTQYKFLGPLDQKKIPKTDDGDFAFRLSVKKAPVMLHDQLEELVLRTVEGADDIRRSVKKIDKERRESSEKKLSPIVRKEKKPTKSKSAPPMDFSCFRAIDKAYKDRAKMEYLLNRVKKIRELKEVEDLSLERVRAHNFTNRNIASLRKKKDKMMHLNALAYQKQKELEGLDKIDARRSTMRDKQQKNIEDYNFAVEFNCQNASVGKALANHDRTNRREEITVKKCEHIETVRSATKKRREIINGYMDGVKLTRQIENSTMKREIHDKVHEKLLERFDDQMNDIKFQKEQKGRHMAGATLLPVKQFNNTMEQVDFF